MSLHSTYHFYKHILINSIKITISWLLVGIIAFIFENLLLYSYQIDIHHSYPFYLYILPPVIVGFPLAIAEQTYLENHFRKHNFQFFVIVKGLFYVISIGIVYYIIWLFFFQHKSNVAHLSAVIFLSKFLYIWGIGTIFITIFKNLSEHFDKKNFFIWLTGKYFQPFEEKRIFLFMDLNDSTSIAENLGHIKYFQLIDDFYNYTAGIISRYNGEIYQYVGDEVVITWNMRQGIKNSNAVRLFFKMQQQINKHKDHFLKHYGVVPTFKGSLHYGCVTRGEIGVLKKDFIFTGDVLNTASRMHSLCKKFDATLVISKELLYKFSLPKFFKVEDLGIHNLKGKQKKNHVFGVNVR